MLALLLGDILLKQDIVTDILFDGSLKNRMKKANKLGAQQVLLLGPDELAAHTVTIKNMITGQEQLLNQVDVVDYLKG